MTATSFSATSDSEIAFLDILDPAFRVDAHEVRAAADADWWARTPIGIAVLRYQECQELLRERRLRQGSLDALAAYGVTSGPFVDWLRATLFVATANRETSTFGDAPFDITAQRPTHLSLGSGIHYCLGNWLARIELREALPILAARFGEIALDGRTGDLAAPPRRHRAGHPAAALWTLTGGRGR